MTASSQSPHTVAIRPLPQILEPQHPPRVVHSEAQLMKMAESLGAKSEAMPRSGSLVSAGGKPLTACSPMDVCTQELDVNAFDVSLKISSPRTQISIVPPPKRKISAAEQKKRFEELQKQREEQKQQKLQEILQKDQKRHEKALELKEQRLKQIELQAQKNEQLKERLEQRQTLRDQELERAKKEYELKRSAELQKLAEAQKARDDETERRKKLNQVLIAKLKALKNGEQDESQREAIIQQLKQNGFDVEEIEKLRLEAAQISQACLDELVDCAIPDNPPPQQETPAPQT